MGKKTRPSIGVVEFVGRRPRKGKFPRKILRARAGKPTGEKLTGSEAATLDEVLERLNIRTWDLVLFGDGSGSNWGKEVGWASVSVERATRERLVWAGAANRGTVNFAEIMAYLQPLTYFAGREADKRRDNGRARVYNVHIITDSQYCRDTGNLRSAAVHKNSGLWACIQGLARHGLVVRWHWMKRGKSELNKYCDGLSRTAREWIAEMTHPSAPG